MICFSGQAVTVHLSPARPALYAMACLLCVLFRILPNGSLRGGDSQRELRYVDDALREMRGHEFTDRDDSFANMLCYPGKHQTSCRGGWVAWLPAFIAPDMCMNMDLARAAGTSGSAPSRTKSCDLSLQNRKGWTLRVTSSRLAQCFFNAMDCVKASEVQKRFDDENVCEVNKHFDCTCAPLRAQCSYMFHTAALGSKPPAVRSCSA